MKEGQDGKPSLLERGMHYALLFVMTGLIVFAALFVYINVTQKAEQKMPEIEENEKAAAKPLPDYMIETLKPDELEILKPQ